LRRGHSLFPPIFHTTVSPTGQGGGRARATVVMYRLLYGRVRTLVHDTAQCKQHT